MIYILPILGVLFSFFLVYFSKPKNKEHYRLLLAFSGAFLLALTIFELLPSVYMDTDGKRMGVFIMAGILLQIFLEFFSKGAEHGHVHISAKNSQFPWLLFVSLSMHSILEGIPMAQNQTIVYGIVIHKVAIAAILSMFLLKSSLKPTTSFIFMLLFSIMTPLGTFITGKSSFLSQHAHQLNALVIGVLLHVSTIILFESSEGHKFNLRKLLVIFLGIIIAYFL